MRVIAGLMAAGLMAGLMTGCGTKTSRAKSDLADLQYALTVYLSENGAYPDGTTAEICALLTGRSVRGQNPKRLDYIVAKRGEQNERGEFLDPWGTPYRFSMTAPPRIYSCGPNRHDENGAGDDISG